MTILDVVDIGFKILCGIEVILIWNGWKIWKEWFSK